MKRYLNASNPLAIRHNQRVCRIARSRPGHKACEVRFLPRIRDIDTWLAMGGAKPSLSIFAHRHGPGPIDALKHAIPFHLFPLSDRIEATRLRAKGVIL